MMKDNELYCFCDQCSPYELVDAPFERAAEDEAFLQSLLEEYENMQKGKQDAK